MTPARPILVREETLDPSFVPPRLVHRDAELDLLRRRYRDALGKGLPFHLMVNGGVGSGKTALVRKLAADLERGGRLGGFPVKAAYVNCWRRASDRTLLAKARTMWCPIDAEKRRPVAVSAEVRACLSVP